MPRFYFHVRLHDLVVEDADGLVLPDLAAARAEAIRGARVITAGEDEGGEDEGCFEISSEDGELLLEVPFHQPQPKEPARSDRCIH
ncbi:DUF6894 family protein [Rhizobium sp. CC-YZS058]|uniref:DUF6894 family protein n=1 Tax=Rhizobium sp. CC-YZS058 TaxID=3042153 RepID=UPI002B05252C|nr:hypothetical protein [Rhizobium sp. CC-YZS058]MEA3537370.1 hypothetical protein [Rhizobium sp. CC-YZS058]